MNDLITPFIKGRALKQVAQRAGKRQSWLSARMHGNAAITSDDVYLLAKGLQCDPCEFFRSEADPIPIPSREDREASFLDPDELTSKFMDVTREDLELLAAFISFWKARQAEEMEV